MPATKFLLVSTGVIVVAFIICLIASELEGADRVLQENGLRTFYTIGGLISLMSVFQMMFHAFRREPALRLVPWAVVFLAGILIISLQWGVAASLAGVAIAVIIRDVVQGRSASPGTQSPPDMDEPGWR